MKNTMDGFKVTCEKVSYSPPGQPELKILKEVDFTVNQGEFLTIIGGNGTGKSTLLKAIAGELMITAGKILISGRHINNEPIQSRIDGVGIVHQRDDDDLLHAFSIAMNVAFRQTNNGCHPHRFWACSKRYCSNLAKKIAEHGLEIDVDQLVGYLSGGERQMLNVVIATHLEHENNPCKLILLDEHTSGLDHKNAFRVMSFTQKKIKETKTTAIMVTHRYSDAIEYSDRIVVMGNGAIKDIYIKSDENWSVDKLTKAVENFS